MWSATAERPGPRVSACYLHTKKHFNKTVHDIYMLSVLSTYFMAEIDLNDWFA